MPPTVMIAGPADLEPAAQTLGFPLVLKIPDSAFSRGVKKAADFAELKSLAEQWLEDSDLADRPEIHADRISTGASACSAASRCLPSII